MTTSVVTGIGGAAIGFFVGGPQGAAWGWAIGSTVGNVLDPQVIRGPSLGDIQQQTSQEGVPIPIIFGLSPPMSGNVWASAPPRVVTETSSGKGGPKVESEVIYRTYAVEFCEGPIGAFIRVWRNNVKVYDALDPVFTEPDFVLGSSDFGPSRNETFLEKARFYLGTYDQDASPDLEAIYGVGTTAANRGIAYMVIVDEDCTREAGVIPQWKVQVSATKPTVREVYAQYFSTGSPHTYEPHGISRVDVLALAGGGSGGNRGAGGGGAGGMVISLGRPVVPGAAMTVEVGAGGVGVSGTDSDGTDGGDSTFDGLTAIGGGGGAGPLSTGPTTGQGRDGGCGGGGGRRLTNGNNPGGLGGVGVQGFSGGQGWQTASCGNSGYGGGGGGLAGVGQGGTNSGDKAGGPGITLESTGFGGAFLTPISFGAGGGGGGCNGGSGGSPGGGGHGTNTVGGGGTNAAANRGSGGGGRANGAAGNSGSGGFVLIRERHPDAFMWTDSDPNVKAYLRVFDAVQDLTGNSDVTVIGNGTLNFPTCRQRIITPAAFCNSFDAANTNSARYVQLQGAPSDFVFPGEFCIEGHFLYPALAGVQQENTLFIVGGYASVPDTSAGIGVHAGGGIGGPFARLRLTVGNTVVYTGTDGQFPINTVHHVALLRVRVSGVLTLRLYLNGVQIYSAANSTTFGNTVVGGLSTIYVGRGNPSGFSRDWNGYWNRFKVTNGAPVYTANFTPPTTFNSSGIDDLDGMPIADVLESICEKAGVQSSRLDASEIIGGVPGIHVTNQYPASQALLALGQIYHFDIASFDNKLHFIPRGRNSVATITEDQMVEDETDIEQERRADSIQIPRLLQLTYHDASSRQIQSPGHGPFPPLDYTWHNDALSPQKQSSERPEDRRATGEMTIQSAVVMDADTAARACAVMHKVMAEDQKGELRFNLPDNFISLAPADPIIVQWNGKSERARVQRVDIMDGFQQYTCLRDRQSAYTSQIEGVPPPIVPSPPSQVGGPTLVVPLDVPLLADPDDSLGLGYYVAVTGFTEAWSGALVELSRDGGANYTESRTATARAVIGELTSTLPDHPQAYPDDTSEFTLRLYAPGAALLDSDLAGMLNGQNLAAVGNPEDGWELINFANVEETDPDFREWTVSGLLRGRKHTATREHPSATMFVLLDRNVLHFQQANLTDIGRTLTLRATTVGETVSSATTTEMQFTGQTQVEFPVGYLMADRDGSDVHVSWQGAGRIGSGVQVAHGVSFTGYRVIFDDGVSTLTVPTLLQEITQDVSSLSSPITVRVVQANSLTGDGPSTEVTI